MCISKVIIFSHIIRIKVKFQANIAQLVVWYHLYLNTVTFKTSKNSYFYAIFKYFKKFTLKSLLIFSLLSHIIYLLFVLNFINKYYNFSYWKKTLSFYNFFLKFLFLQKISKDFSYLLILYRVISISEDIIIFLKLRNLTKRRPEPCFTLKIFMSLDRT